MNSVPITFSDYLGLGIQHITDFEGYDHMLFLLALCAAFTLVDWKKALILATAFTIGHSITLIAAGLELVRFDSGWIEFLIPVTIFFAALRHWFPLKNQKQKLSFWICMAFGFIHGMGFSTFIRMVSGKDGFVPNLIAFNLGVEVGQIMIVMVILLSATLVVKFTKIQKAHWTKVISALAVIISLLLIVQKWPF